MNTISGNIYSGFNQSQMTQGINDKFKAADLDGNEALSKQEFVNALEATGLDSSKMDKMFNQMDSNGDGQLSHQEQQDMMQIMEQRMASLMGSGGQSQEGYDAVQALLDALQTESDSSADQQKLQDALEKMRTSGYDESVMSESLSLINDIIPGINTSA